MVEVKEISREQLEPLVRNSYEHDADLLAKYHVKENMTLDEAVNATLYMIDEAATEVELSYYKVMNDENEIGYFCYFKDCLYSFGVSVLFRTRSILIYLFEKIKNVLRGTFYCILYKNNERAIKWLIKNGMDVTGFNDNSVSLIYNKQN